MHLKKALEVIDDLKAKLQGHKDVILYQHGQLIKLREQNRGLRVELDRCRKDRQYEVIA